MQLLGVRKKSYEIEKLWESFLLITNHSHYLFYFSKINLEENPLKKSAYQNNGINNFPQHRVIRHCSSSIILFC